jgi:hypothetical protein
MRVIGSVSAALFTRVLEIDPDYTEAIYRLAFVSWKLGHREEARAHDREYLQRGQHSELNHRFE